MKDKAELLHKSKLILNLGLVREVVIWKVVKGEYYPEGIKYRLVLYDPVWKKVILLFDNHAPKGHHIHLVDGEKNYKFKSVAILFEDYLKQEFIQERKYENNED